MIKDAHNFSSSGLNIRQQVRAALQLGSSKGLLHQVQLAYPGASAQAAGCVHFEQTLVRV